MAESRSLREELDAARSKARHGRTLQERATIATLEPVDLALLNVVDNVIRIGNLCREAIFAGNGEQGAKYMDQLYRELAAWAASLGD